MFGKKWGGKGKKKKKKKRRRREEQKKREKNTSFLSQCFVYKVENKANM